MHSCWWKSKRDARKLRAAANDNGAWAKYALLSGPPGVGKYIEITLTRCEDKGIILKLDKRLKRLLRSSDSKKIDTISTVG